MERFVYQTRLKVNREKTEVLQMGHQMEELDGNKLNQRDSFMYLARRREDGERERGTSKSAGWNECMESS